MILPDVYYALSILLAVITVILAARAMWKMRAHEFGPALAFALIVATVTIEGIATKRYFGEEGRQAYIESRS